MDLKQERADLLKSAQNIMTAAKDAGRELTEDERGKVAEQVKSIELLDVRIKQQGPSYDPGILAYAAAGTYEGPGGGSVDGQFLDFSVKSRGEMAAKSLTAARGTYGTKALPASGVSLTSTVQLTGPVAFNQPAPGLLSVIPISPVGAPTYSYLRQTVRTNNAAPVAVGGTKPTSVYTLNRIDDRLRVIAHLSEQLDRFWLEDFDLLRGFIQSEMLYGVQLALEAQIITGAGTGENFTGILNLSGIQTQAVVAGTYAIVTTARNAATKLENLGQYGGYFVLNPADWQTVELLQTTTNAYLLSSGSTTDVVPIESATRKLWGRRVVLSTAMTAGTGLLVADGAVRLVADTVGVRTEWSDNIASDFTTNQLRCRTEGRFGLVVEQPLNVVKMAFS